MKKTLKILSDEKALFANQFFSSFGTVQLLPADKINSQSSKDYDVLVCRSKTKIDEKLLAKSRIKFVLSTVSGTDHIDFEYLQKNNINYYCAKGCNKNAVVDYVFTKILDFAEKHQYNLFTTTNKTSIGIIGFGYVGQLLAKTFAVLDFEIFIYDPPLFTLQNHPKPKQYNICNSLEDLTECDIISLHCSLEYNNHFNNVDLINHHFLQKIKPNQLLINAARGELINEEECLQWCEKSSNKNLIIDCWQNEPHINQKLLPYCFSKTPHIAGHSLSAIKNGVLWSAEYLAKKTKINFPKDSSNISQPTININFENCNNLQTALAKMYGTALKYPEINSHRQTFLISREQFKPNFQMNEIMFNIEKVNQELKQIINQILPSLEINYQFIDDESYI